MQKAECKNLLPGLAPWLKSQGTRSRAYTNMGRTNGEICTLFESSTVFAFDNVINSISPAAPFYLSTNFNYSCSQPELFSSPDF
jgi:hypothetical protein